MSSNSRKKRIPKPSSSSPPNKLLNSLPSSKSDFFRLISVISIAAAVALSCNFISTFFNLPEKPFCDTTTSNYQDDDFLSDSCQPCPMNGVCYDGKLECRPGYIMHGKLCVEDGDINEAARKLSKWVEVRACQVYAQFLCTGTGKCWVSEDELLDNIYEDKERSEDGSEEANYMLAKQRAMKTIRNLLETRRDNHDVEEFKCPELLVDHYKPLSCAVRQWIIKHALALVPACALIIGCILITFRVYQRHHLSVRAEKLYHEVCDILEEKPLMSRSIGGESEPWIVASWLRDHLLSPKERKDPLLWKKVEELVQEDSRVEQYPKLVKGESKVVWEWQVEGSIGSSGKRKTNVGSASKQKEYLTSSIKLRPSHAAA